MTPRTVIVYVEYAAALPGVLIYLLCYLRQGRGEWYRSVYGIGQVTLGAVAAVWYVKGLTSSGHNVSVWNLVAYGIFVMVFWLLAAGALWAASPRAQARREARSRA